MKQKKVFRQDYKHTQMLTAVAAKCTADAIQHSKESGLTITFIEDGIIYEEFPDGRLVKIGTVERSVLPAFRIKKGMILQSRQ